VCLSIYPSIYGGVQDRGTHRREIPMLFASGAASDKTPVEDFIVALRLT